MPTTHEHIASHPLCSRLSTQQIARLARAGEIERYKAGEVIVAEGSIGDALYLLLEGSAAVLIQAKAGAAPGSRSDGGQLGSLGAGEFFGEMSLIEPATRSATVRAADDCLLFRLPHTAVQSLLADDANALHIFLIAILRTLSQRLRKTNERFGSIGQLSEYLAGSIV